MPSVRTELTIVGGGGDMIYRVDDRVFVEDLLVRLLWVDADEVSDLETTSSVSRVILFMYSCLTFRGAYGQQHRSLSPSSAQ